MLLPSPHDFFQQIHEASLKKMQEHGEVGSTLFMNKMGEDMLVVDVTHLMADSDKKDVLSMLPAYVGMIRNGLDFVALVSGAWMVNISAVTKLYGESKASDHHFIMELVKNAGGVSQLPLELREEKVYSSIWLGTSEYITAWDVIRDDAENASLSSHEDAHVLDATKSGGRFTGMLHRYYQLQDAFKALSEGMKGENITIERLADALSFAELTDTHSDAYQLATAICASMPNPAQLVTIQ